MQISKTDYGFIVERDSLFKKPRTICYAVTLLLLLSPTALAQTPPTELDTEQTSEATNEVVNLNPLTSLDRNRLNESSENIDGQREFQNADDGAAPGIRIGTMTLRPSVSSQILYEIEKTATASESRTYNQTTLGATLQSDWSRHALNVTGTGTLQKNISGTLAENPSANLATDLELNINDLLTANLRGGYSFTREDRNDPNAVTNATDQANIHTFTSSLALTKEVGIIRGSITGNLTRVINGDAILPGYIVVSGNDRDLLTLGLAIRLQYAANPVLMPFIEGEIGGTKYDQTIDSSGANRAYTNYGLRLGLAADLGDKLSGEFSVGYTTNTYDDLNLPDIDAFTLDSELTWSPRRGTSALFGLATTIDPSTTADQSGSILYAATLDVTQEITRNIDATFGVNYSLRDFQGSASVSDESIYGASIALDWAINRYLSLNTDVSYARTNRSGATNDIDNTRFGLGLTLTR